ncbi:nucleoside monophosphate kinase [Candidatus Kaiserbacteria bacterium]|nr:nucleoside monophosphate kinase [Candidatus Kaiserbacteria bacterium]
MSPYTIIFIGPQGSGKGTQIERLDAALRVRHPTDRIVTLQTGRLFRALAHKQVNYTERHVSETIDTGILQPHFLTVVLWGEVLVSQLDPTSHLLIDGVPRTLEQAHLLDEAFRFYNRGTLTIVNLVASDDVVRERMQGRARPDDTPEAIEERLRAYHTDTVPVLDFYRARPDTVVLDIDGTKSVEEIHDAILEGIGSSRKQ